MRRNIGMAEDDGFYLTDTATGKTRLLASIADLIAQADPPVMFALKRYALHNGGGRKACTPPLQDGVTCRVAGTR